MSAQKISCLLLALGVSLFPIYLLPSGLPQASHLVLLVFSIWALILNGLSKRQILSLIPLWVLVWFVVSRQSFYSISENPSVLAPAAYVVFNALIFYSVYRQLVLYSDDTLKALKGGVIVSVAISLIGVFVLGFSLVVGADDTYRNVGTFNNPNQLGYYAVCIAGLGSVLFVLGRCSRVTFLFILTAAFFLAVLSLSKAAMVSIVIYLGILTRLRRSLSNLLIFALLAVFVIALLQHADFEQFKFIQRLADIGHDSDDSLEGRGYQILFNPDIRLIYGWGEGFALNTIGFEVHSTFGNLIISYGIVGFGLFLVLIGGLFFRLLKAWGLVIASSLMFPFVLYGIAHNGFRFSIFWIYLAVLFFAGRNNHQGS
ncbi:O-antigen ligase family protein [Variovorax terrae]|uniref:Uncharacterized protein n=1 Tax=Variovorax terrae TaxID=2923278 RepID=A0A9X2AP02_9BURK|nr:hypothetical protein [Variovorax terrae]MCJ0764330.1 hypothetical protein [Variovorax terrae]